MEDNIFELLEENNKLMLKLVDIVSESHRWYSVYELGKRLNVVERTIQRYIYQLKEKIDKYNETQENPIILHYEKFKGIQLDMVSDNNYTEFKMYIFETDERIKILKKIILEDCFFVRKYAIRNFKSENSIRKNLKEIKQFLNIYGISLSRGTFRFIGEEKNIRGLIFILNWVLFKGEQWPFESVDQKKAYETLDSFSSTFNLSISEIQKKQMSYILAINLIRVRKNRIIKFEPEWKGYLNIQNISKSVPFLNYFIERYQISEESEIYFYILLLQMKTKFYESEHLKYKIFNYHKKCQSDIYLATQSAIDKFGVNFFPIPLEAQDQFFITSFCAHLFCKVFPQSHIDLDGYNVLNAPDYNFPNLRERVDQFIDELYQETKNDLFLNKEFLLQKYMLLFSSSMPLNFYEPVIKIRLETDFPVIIKKNLKAKISNYFSLEFNIVFITDKNKQKPDIVLTNIPNRFVTQKQSVYQSYIFDFPIKERDLVEIRKRLRAILRTK